MYSLKKTVQKLIQIILHLLKIFLNGLEVGNKVFMQYKYFHDGSYEELPIKIIDTGIESISWLVNGSPTSDFDVFAGAFAFLTQKLYIEYSNDFWKTFGPYSCLLNVDEVENFDKTWEFISSQIGYDVQTIKREIEQLKEMYIILDRTRTVMMVVTDGSLPSNVGGGSNIIKKKLMEKMVFLSTQYLEISFLGELLLKEHLINITNKIILAI